MAICLRGLAAVLRVVIVVALVALVGFGSSHLYFVSDGWTCSVGLGWDYLLVGCFDLLWGVVMWGDLVLVTVVGFYGCYVVVGVW